MRWTIYYSDGSTFSSEDGTPRGEKARGVQGIVQDHPTVGAEIVTASDYYVWKQGRWWGVDHFGLYDYLLHLGCVLGGEMIERHEYDAIFRRMAKDKQGWLPHEVKADG